MLKEKQKQQILSVNWNIKAVLSTWAYNQSIPPGERQSNNFWEHYDTTHGCNTSSS